MKKKKHTSNASKRRADKLSSVPLFVGSTAFKPSEKVEPTPSFSDEGDFFARFNGESAWFGTYREACEWYKQKEENENI